VHLWRRHHQDAPRVELLELSQGLDRQTIPRGPNAEAFQVLVTFAVRARRLVRAIYALLDEGLDIEAQMLGRVLMETTVTLQWMAVDLRARIPNWRLDDARVRLAWDDAYATAHEGQRLMSAEGRRQIEALRDRLIGAGATRPPEFWERCAEIEPTWHTLIYRHASHGAMHPSAMALGRFIERVDEQGAHVLADGPETRDDAYRYEPPALWLQLTLDVLSRVAPGAFRWQDDLERIGARMAERIIARER
jgi:hypothetical protein